MFLLRCVFYCLLGLPLTTFAREILDESSIAMAARKAAVESGLVSARTLLTYSDIVHDYECQLKAVIEITLGDGLVAKVRTINRVFRYETWSNWRGCGLNSVTWEFVTKPSATGLAHSTAPLPTVPKDNSLASLIIPEWIAIEENPTTLLLSLASEAIGRLPNGAVCLKFLPATEEGSIVRFATEKIPQNWQGCPDAATPNNIDTEYSENKADVAVPPTADYAVELSLGLLAQAIRDACNKIEPTASIDSEAHGNILSCQRTGVSSP